MPPRKTGLNLPEIESSNLANRFLVRTAAGDHLARSEAEILDWLRKGHCGPGDFVFSEQDSSWLAVCDLPLIAPIFSAKPSAKVERPVITVFRLGRGKTLQEGPFTLSAVLEMLQAGDLCAASWIFVEGDTEWRQVKNVRVLREALRQPPKDQPRLDIGAVAPAEPLMPRQAPATLLPDKPPRTLAQELGVEDDSAEGHISLGIEQNSDPGLTKQSQPSIVPLPSGLIPAEPAAVPTLTKTQTLIRPLPSADTSEPFPGLSPESKQAPAVSFVPIPDANPVPSPPKSDSDLYTVQLDVPMPALATTDLPNKSVQGTGFDTSTHEVIAIAAPMPPRNLENADDVPEEEQTKAFSKLGLAQAVTVDPALVAIPPAAPIKASAPVRPPVLKQGKTGKTAAPGVAGIASAAAVKVPPPPEEPFDGLTVEIPQDPIWLIKHDRSDRVSGPLTYQQVMDLLETKQLSRDDKISRSGTNRFNKISQQYEFNVQSSIETIVEGGVERQKILIKRRHPRVAYITEVYVSKIGRSWLAQCVNVSAGGILLESSEIDVELGDTVEIVMMPGEIERKISASALVIGKIPKRPPGFALRFLNLQRDDKEAIEYYVLNSLKKEKAMGL